MAKLRIYPSKNRPAAGNMRFTREAGGTIATARLQARQIRATSTSLLLLPGTVLTCEYDRDYIGGKYYRADATNNPEAWTQAPLFDDVRLYPTEPVDEWFDVPLDLSGATLPETTDAPELSQRYATYFEEDFQIISAPTNPDATSRPTIQVVSTPRGVVTAAATITKGDEKWKEYADGILCADAGARLVYRGHATGVYRAPRAMYAVYKNGSWSVQASGWDSPYDVDVSCTIAVEY